MLAQCDPTTTGMLPCVMRRRAGHWQQIGHSPTKAAEGARAWAERLMCALRCHAAGAPGGRSGSHDPISRHNRRV